MTIEKLKKLVEEGKYAAINSQGASVSGSDFSQYTPKGWTYAPLAEGDKYHVDRNGGIQMFDFESGEWFYIKSGENDVINGLPNK